MTRRRLATSNERHRVIARRHRPTGDRGAATAWALLLVVAGGLFSALVTDGGNAMAARVHTLDLAQQTARAGANQLDLDVLRGTGQLQLDPAAAETAATDYLNQAADVPTTAVQITASPGLVTVTISRDEPTLLLRVVGMDTFAITVTADAEPATSPGPAALRHRETPAMRDRR